MPENDFEKILLSAVEEGFSSLGDSSKQAIFFRLETSYQVNREKIPTNLTEFKDALEGIFGPGAQYLEKTITRRLHEKLGLEFEEGEWTDFLGCVKTAEKRIKPRKDRARK